jgi:hypothetical protein
MPNCRSPMVFAHGRAVVDYACSHKCMRSVYSIVQHNAKEPRRLRVCLVEGGTGAVGKLVCRKSCWPRPGLTLAIAQSGSGA